MDGVGRTQGLRVRPPQPIHLDGRRKPPVTARPNTVPRRHAPNRLELPSIALPFPNDEFKTEIELLCGRDACSRNLSLPANLLAAGIHVTHALQPRTHLSIARLYFPSRFTWLLNLHLHFTARAEGSAESAKNRSEMCSSGRAPWLSASDPAASAAGARSPDDGHDVSGE